MPRSEKGSCALQTADKHLKQLYAEKESLQRATEEFEALWLKYNTSTDEAKTLEKEVEVLRRHPGVSRVNNAKTRLNIKESMEDDIDEDEVPQFPEQTQPSDEELLDIMESSDEERTPHPISKIDQEDLYG